MVAAWPAADAWVIWAPVSDEPTASITSRVGSAARRRSFSAGVEGGAAVATTTNSDDRSCLPVSISSRIGRAMASPTTSMLMTFSRRRRSTARRPGRALHDVVGHHDGAAAGAGDERGPLGGAVHERRRRQHAQAAAAGDRGLGDGLVALEGGSGGADGPPAHGADVDVGLAPEHALGHAGGAAGVEDVEVVGRAARPAGASGDDGGEDRLVVDRAGEQRRGRVPSSTWMQHPQLGQLGEHLGERCRRSSSRRRWPWRSASRRRYSSSSST